MTDAPKALVLWHRYGDGSAAHIERVYIDDEKRANEDLALLTEGEGKAAFGEWHLDPAPVFGGKEVADG